MTQIIMILALLFGGQKPPAVGASGASGPTPSVCIVVQGSDIGC